MLEIFKGLELKFGYFSCYLYDLNKGSFNQIVSFQLRRNGSCLSDKFVAWYRRFEEEFALFYLHFSFRSLHGVSSVTNSFLSGESCFKDLRFPCQLSTEIRRKKENVIRFVCLKVWELTLVLL